MTPAEHITAAENTFTQVADLANMWSEQERVSLALIGIGHAVIALAIELGAPHTPTAAGSPSDG